MQTQECVQFVWIKCLWTLGGNLLPDKRNHSCSQDSPAPKLQFITSTSSASNSGLRNPHNVPTAEVLDISIFSKLEGNILSLSLPDHLEECIQNPLLQLSEILIYLYNTNLICYFLFLTLTISKFKGSLLLFERRVLQKEHVQPEDS